MVLRGLKFLLIVLLLLYAVSDPLPTYVDPTRAFVPYEPPYRAHWLIASFTLVRPQPKSGLARMDS